MLRFNTSLPEGMTARPAFAAYIFGLQSALILVAPAGADASQEN
jgi:hypothetical protein